MKRAWIWSLAILLVVVVSHVLVASVYKNLSEKGWTTYTPRKSGLVSGFVKALAIDDAGRVWVGTCGGGLSALAADGSWTTYN